MSGMLLALCWFASCLAVLGAGYVGISRIVGHGIPLGLRVVLAIVAVLIGQYLAGLSLLLAGGFGTGALIAIVLAAAGYLGWAWRSADTRAVMAADLETIRGEFRTESISRRALWLAAIPAGIGWLTVLRGTVSPPMDWDYFTYHGPRAAFWALEGALAHSYDAAGSWQLYQAFPIAGDLLSSWSMALTSGDVAVAPTWIAIWLATGFVAHLLIRRLGGTPRNAVLGAIAVLTLPGAFHHMSSGYVDNAVALALLAGVLCFVEAETTRRPLLATVAMAALAMAAAIKFTALPFLALGAALWAWLHLRDFTRIRLPATVAGVAIVCVTALAWPAHLFVTQGNPVYPFWLNLFGITFVGAMESIREVTSDRRSLDFLEASAAFFWNGFYRDPLLHNGFGPGGLLAVLAGILSLCLRAIRGPVTFSAATAGALLFLAWILAIRVNYPGIDDVRYIVIAGILAVIALARMSDRWSAGLLIAAIAADLIYVLPWRWSVLDALAVTICLAAGLGLALLVLLPKSGRGRVWRPASALAVASLVTALAIGPAVRDTYFIGLGRDQHFNSGPVAFAPAGSAYPIWNLLADADPMSIAVAAGTSTLNTHWFIHPLLGRRLQHRLLYLPTGLYYPDERDIASPQDFDRAGQRWLAGLETGGVDAVMLHAPDPVERRWVEANPRSFELLSESEDGGSALYRFVRDEAPAAVGPTAER